MWISKWNQSICFVLFPVWPRVLLQDFLLINPLVDINEHKPQREHNKQHNVYMLDGEEGHRVRACVRAFTLKWCAAAPLSASGSPLPACGCAAPECFPSAGCGSGAAWRRPPDLGRPPAWQSPTWTMKKNRIEERWKLHQTNAHFATPVAHTFVHSHTSFFAY